MPDFEVEGNPGNIRSKAVLMEQKGTLFWNTGDALSKIDVSGWTGRAADEFREAHDLEPDRWTKAGNGFKKAASGLTTYAGELEDAQRRAREAKAEYERGQRESESARTQYDSYMGRMRTYWASGGTDQAEPFVDFGDPIQQEALRAMQSVRSDLDNAAHTCAGQVRAGCADAPEEPNWLESGLKFVGGILEGAGEAVWDLLTMVPFSPVNLVIDSYKLATGDLTPEELAKKYELSAENAWDMATGIYTGLTTDPVGFGKNLGKSLLDWDTWADDPARAIGHLVPDAVAAVATAGTGALATRGAKGGMEVLDGLSDLNKLDRLSELEKLDDLSDLRRLDEPFVPDLASMTNKEKAELFDIDNPQQGMRVWRVFGEAQDDLGGLERGSRPFGESWTPRNPLESGDFRRDAGLPDENPGRFYVEGILRNPSHVYDVRPALPLDGQPGGWPEYLIRDADQAVEVRDVGGVNETWTHRPGDWSPPEATSTWKP